MGKQVDAGLYGGVAQLGEHLPCKQGVKSSNLSISIRRKQLNESKSKTKLEFSARRFVKLNEVFSNLVERTYIIMYLENCIHENLIQSSN